MSDYIQRRYLCALGIVGIFTGLIIAVVESSKLPTSIPNQNNLYAQQNPYSAQDLLNYRANTAEYKAMIGGIVLAALSFVFTIAMIKLGIFETDTTDNISRRRHTSRKKRVVPYQYLVPPANDIIYQSPRTSKPQIIVHSSYVPAQAPSESYSPELTSTKILLLQNKYRASQLNI